MSGETCQGPECERPAARSGLCWGHLAQAERGKRLTPLNDLLSPSHRPSSAAARLREAAYVMAEVSSEDDRAFKRADDNLQKSAHAFANRSRIESWRRSIEERKARGERVGRPPSRDDQEIAEVVKAVKSIRRAAKLLRCSRDLVRGALERVRQASKDGGGEV